ncbi:MAG TPA: sulfotransferase family 2 domain-containing protein [Sphingomonas sp.]|jgi:hypothetical protein
MPVHVLHIGKTGGTAVKHVLRPFADQGLFVLHGHAHRLRDCPADALVFFVVRHPVDRFVSAFNSRLRQGRPRHDVPWSRKERLAFRIFPSPNHLAEAIGSRNPLTRAAARWAMRGIGHVGTPLSYWLESADYLTNRGQVIIGTMHDLDRDLNRVLAIAGAPSRAILPSDPLTAHVTPPGMSTALSEQGRAHLTCWLKEDIALYEHCLTLAAANPVAKEVGFHE